MKVFLTNDKKVKKNHKSTHRPITNQGVAFIVLKEFRHSVNVIRQWLCSIVVEREWLLDSSEAPG